MKGQNFYTGNFGSASCRPVGTLDNDLRLSTGEYLNVANVIGEADFNFDGVAEIGLGKGVRRPSHPGN